MRWQSKVCNLTDTCQVLYKIVEEDILGVFRHVFCADR
jgi:hypothetical protein